MELIDDEYEILEDNITRRYPGVSVNEILLLSACKSGNYDIIQWILSFDYKFMFSLLDNLGFYIACENNHVEIAKSIYKRCNVKCTEEIIFMCCEEGNLDILIWLYETFPHVFYSLNHDKKYEIFELACNYIEIAVWLSTVYNDIPIYKDNHNLFLESCKYQHLELACLLVSMRNGGYFIQIVDDEIVHYDIISDLVINNKIKIGGTYECVICYKTANIVTECFHYYCTECLETHINKNNRNCPYCRAYMCDNKMAKIII